MNKGIFTSSLLSLCKYLIGVLLVDFCEMVDYNISYYVKTGTTCIKLIINKQTLIRVH